MEIIRTYVQDLGGGLVMLGGDQSFGLGGYYKTTLEEILPVRSNFEKEKEKPSLAMVLVIDKSDRWAVRKWNWPRMLPRAPPNCFHHPTNWALWPSMAMPTG